MDFRISAFVDFRESEKRILHISRLLDILISKYPDYRYTIHATDSRNQMPFQPPGRQDFCFTEKQTHKNRMCKKAIRGLTVLGTAAMCQCQNLMHSFTGDDLARYNKNHISFCRTPSEQHQTLCRIPEAKNLSHYEVAYLNHG